MALLPLLAAAASMHAVDVPATFGDKIDQVRAKSGLVVLLPQTIPSDRAKLYPDGYASKGSWSLNLGVVEDCGGANACGAAYFGATKGGKPHGDVKVELAQGRHGFFTPTHCGASCAPPEVTWKQDGAVYFVQIKGLSSKREKRVTRRAANSAIRHGARSSATEAKLRTFDVPRLIGAEKIDTMGSSSLIDVLLPETVRTDAKKLYPDVLADPGKWTAWLDLAKGCDGAPPCDYARFVGKEKGRLRGGVKVSLSGRTGRFYKSTCGANCTPARIRFKFNGHRYELSAPEPRQTMIDLANSAIDNGPR